MCLNSELILFPVSKQSSGECILTICHEISHVCTNHDEDAQQVIRIKSPKTTGSIDIHYSGLAGCLQLDVLEHTGVVIMVPRVSLHQNQSRLHVSK